MVKYALAPDADERLGGELAHIVVMQHVNKDHLQLFLDDLKQIQYLASSALNQIRYIRSSFFMAQHQK